MYDNVRQLDVCWWACIQISKYTIVHQKCVCYEPSCLNKFNLKKEREAEK